MNSGTNAKNMVVDAQGFGSSRYQLRQSLEQIGMFMNINGWFRNKVM